MRMTFLSDFLLSVPFPNTTLCVRVRAGRSRCVWNGGKTSPNCVHSGTDFTAEEQPTTNHRGTLEWHQKALICVVFLYLYDSSLSFVVCFSSLNPSQCFVFYQYQLDSYSFHSVSLKENVLNTVTNAALFLTHSICPLISFTSLQTLIHFTCCRGNWTKKHTRTCTHFGVHGSVTNSFSVEKRVSEIGNLICKHQCQTFQNSRSAFCSFENCFSWNSLSSQPNTSSYLLSVVSDAWSAE